MRRVIRKDKIFIAISIVFLASLFIIYGYRFIHYYRLEANIVDDTEISEPISIYNHLLTYLPEDDILIQKENGLIKNEDNTYYFKGQVENNFVYYSGRLWRIIKTTKDKNIVLISEEIQTLMPYGEDIEYQNSYLYNYLNNIDEYSLFYKTLNNTDILVNTQYCEDVVTDTENVTCKVTKSDYQVTLLNLKDYLNSGANKGYLNTNSYFWLMDFNQNNELYYVFDKGGINTTSEYNKHHYGIRPVITIKGDLILNSGDGTIQKPYYIDEYDDYKLINVGVGEYLEYSGRTWRIISKTASSVKVALEGNILEEEKAIEKIFSTKNNTFDINDKNNIAYYLNNDYYNSLNNKEYLVKGPFYTGKYTTDTHDYKLVYKEKINAYIGLPQVGDLYINTYNNTLTSLAITDHMNNILYIINENNSLYTSKINEKEKIRPVINLDGNLIALSGEGTKESPYIIGR